MIKYNPLGGIYDIAPAAIKRAKEVDLITLPKTVKGTNCFNCKFISNIAYGQGYCKHPKVAQMVNSRMCCALWKNSGQWEVWEDAK